ncbi:LysR family transcriptional regulator [Pigmentiphaga soli]|uniref:LysR family transcriptional regulator n=1 Tax=Pigmentiphaga soli TaxID=1007095 RepID=A0ABP8H8I7_9BURK
MIEFKHALYFISLYEEGSVTRAARRLNIVQPALSMQLAKLEAEIGQPLFVRNARGVQPTPEAKRLYKLFMPVLADFAHARDQAVQKKGELVGHVRAGMVVTIAQGALADTLAAFSSAHPKVTVEVVEGYSHALIESVARGKLDVAIVNKPRRPPAVNIQPIVEEEFVLVAGANHAGLPAAIPFRQAAGMKMVLPTMDHGLRSILESLAARAGLELLPALEVDSINAILELVAATDFVTLLPRSAVGRSIARGQIHAHRVKEPSLYREVICATHPKHPLSAAASELARVMIERVRAAARPVPSRRRAAAGR